jgi:arylsulfatase
VRHHGDSADAVLHVTDLVPTILDLVGVERPSAKSGSKLAPLQGISMRPLLEGHATAIRTDKDWIGWELFGNRAIRQGDWKLVYLMKKAGGTGDWQLYNLRDDPTELRDVSKNNPQKRKELLKLWDQYVKQNGVILTGDGLFTEKPSMVAAEDDN